MHLMNILGTGASYYMRFDPLAPAISLGWNNIFGPAS